MTDPASLLNLVTTDSDEWQNWGWDNIYERDVDMMVMCPAATVIAEVARKEGFNVETFSAADCPGWQDVFCVGGLVHCIHLARRVKTNGIVFFAPDYVTWLSYAYHMDTYKRQVDEHDIYGDISIMRVRSANFTSLVVSYLVILLRVRDVYVVVMNPVDSLFFKAHRQKKKERVGWEEAKGGA